MLERSRPSVAGPSSVYGTMASSTVTEAMVRSSRCGLRTRIRISPARNSTRRTSNSSAGGGVPPSEVDDPVALRDDDGDREGEQHDRHERPEPPRDPTANGRRRLPPQNPHLHYSSTWK